MNPLKQASTFPIIRTTLNSQIDFSRLQKTPPSSQIAEHGGQTVHLGWFASPFVTPNVEVAYRLNRGTAATFWLPWRTKRWQFFSLTSKEIMLGVAAVHTGYLSNFFLYAFHLQKRKFEQFEHLVPFFKKADVAASSLEGTTCYQGGGHFLRIENHLKDHYHLLQFSTRGPRASGLQGEIKVWAQGQPLVNSREVAPRRVVYTHQNSMYRPEGRVKWDGEVFTFDPRQDFSTMDYTVGLHSYKTTWNWAAAGGKAMDGTPVAINIAADILTGTNDVVAFWIGEKIYRLSKATFRYGHQGSEWRVQASDGHSIDLLFQPLGQRKGDVSILGIMESRFVQPFGLFQGRIRLESGQEYLLQDVPGVVEEHFAKW